jgi:pimeloyl-ACP methyl ester carboxylesterase
VKEVLIIIGVILVLLVAGVIGLFWHLMNKPLYEPGMVHAGKNLRAPLDAPKEPEDERLWNVEPDVQLYHFSPGEGRNVLVVHGGPGHPYLEPWPGLDPLTDDYRFRYYDQRGCGQSTRPIDTFYSRNFNQNMKTLDQALGIGAQLADIDRIRRFNDIFSQSEADLVALNRELNKYYRAAVDMPIPQQGRAGGWVVQAIYLGIGRRHDYRDALRAVEAPVLVVHGSEDVFQPEGASRIYAEALPNAQFRIVEGSGHFAFHSQPDALARMVGGFLGELE